MKGPKNIEYINPQFAKLINESVQIHPSENVFGMYRIPEPSTLGKNFIFFAGSESEKLLRNSLIYVFIFDQIGREMPVATGKLSITGEYYVSFNVEELGGKYYIYIFGTKYNNEKVYIVQEIMVDESLLHYKDVYQGVSIIQYGNTIDLSWLYREENIPDPSMILTEVICTDLTNETENWYWLGITGKNYFEKSFAKVGDIGFKVRAVRNERMPYAGVMQNLMTTKYLTEYAIDYTDEYNLINQASDRKAWSNTTNYKGTFLPQVSEKSIIAGITFEHDIKSLIIKEEPPNYFSGSIDQFQIDNVKIQNAKLIVDNIDEILELYNTLVPNKNLVFKVYEDDLTLMFKDVSLRFMRDKSIDELLPLVNYLTLQLQAETLDITTDILPEQDISIGAPDYPWNSLYTSKGLIGGITPWQGLFVYLTFNSGTHSELDNPNYNYRFNDETVFSNYGFYSGTYTGVDYLEMIYIPSEKLMFLHRNEFNENEFAIEIGIQNSFDWYEMPT